MTRPDYIRAVFDFQLECALETIDRLAASVGDAVDVVFVSGTDFGSQHGLFISTDAYRSLFKPYHTEVNRRIHEKTNWKTFIHTCGSVWDLLPDLVEAGFDVLNPVQCSAAKMDPRDLKREFGEDLSTTADWHSRDGRRGGEHVELDGLVVRRAPFVARAPRRGVEP